MMTNDLRIAIVGDFDANFPPHVATMDGLHHAADALGLPLAAQWVATPSLETAWRACLEPFHGIYVAPGGPYLSLLGGLNAVTHARENAIPLIATCGGYQHVVIEYARRVLGESDAAHAEYDPYASKLFISALSCSLVGQTLEVVIARRTNAYAHYSRERVSEQYYCNFGLNPNYRQRLVDGGLTVSGTDADGEARILELADHPFFIATLFVPPLTSTPETPHPLLLGFLLAATRFQQDRRRTPLR